MSNVSTISTADVRAIRGALIDLKNLQVELHGKIHQVALSQDATRSDLDELRRTLDAWIHRDRLSKQLQLAQTQIIGVRQELETTFGHYADVRRHATGILQAMDAGIVTQGTIRSTSEELMLRTPRYWLAPALVALGAWIRDDRPLAERALGEALRRDNDRTALLLALVLRRQRRYTATARWVEQYVTRQDPGSLSREFSVVLDAVASGAFGLEAKPVVMDNVGEWYTRLSANDAIVEQQVSRWMTLLGGMRGEIGGYTILPNLSPTWPVLKDLYEGATVHGRAHAHFRRLFEARVDVPPDLERRVDTILDSLVGNFDPEELPLRRDESRLQAIIDHEGDTDAAKATVDAQAFVHEATVDLLTLLTNAAFFPRESGVSTATQRLATAVARDWVVEAVGRLEASNLASMPPAVELAVEGWSGRIDSTSTEAALVRGVEQHVDDQTARDIEAVKVPPKAVLAVIAAVALVVWGIAAIAGGGGAGALPLLGGLAAGGWGANVMRGLPGRRDELRKAGERRKQHAVAQVRGAIAEVADLHDSWSKELSAAKPLREYLQGLTQDAFVVRTADAGREVMR